jgi:MinD-like ATPase involved in chromosome partitioning or flagellar assembly
VLVDADLSGPSVAANIDADPTRNLYMVAHADPESIDEWSNAIEREGQPLGGQSVHGVVLCGAPKLELRTGITPRFLERLIHELRRRFRYVILDIGAELLTREAAPHRAALQCADQVLLVAAADVVGLWHARTGLGLLHGQLGIGLERLALVVNRHDRRIHHGSAEIEWAMGHALAALIPNDHVAAQRSLAAQRPLVLTGRGPASRSMLDLAERVHGGTIRMPAAKARGGKLDLLRRAFPSRLTRSPQLSELKTQGQFDHDHHTRDAARTAGGRPRSHRGTSPARRRAGGSEPPAR